MKHRGHLGWGCLEIDGPVSVTERAKSAAIVLLSQIRCYRLTERPILLFGTRRSGSTLLMRVLASQPHTDYCAEPLRLERLHPHYYRLPHPPFGRFISLNPPEERTLKAYFDELLAGRMKAFAQWNLFDPTYSFLVRRLIVKLISANALIDWFVREFDAHVIFLIRHPIAVASSLANLGWTKVSTAYLENESFRQRFLREQTMELARQMLERGDDIEQYALEWCLENVVPLSLFRERSFLTISYEELVLRRGRIVDLLCERFGLTARDKMLRLLNTPTRTAYASASRRDIRIFGPAARVTSSIERATAEHIKHVQQLLDSFGINVYRAEEPVPSSELLHGELSLHKPGG